MHFISKGMREIKTPDCKHRLLIPHCLPPVPHPQHSKLGSSELRSLNLPQAQRLFQAGEANPRHTWSTAMQCADRLRPGFAADIYIPAPSILSHSRSRQLDRAQLAPALLPDVCLIDGHWFISSLDLSPGTLEETHSEAHDWVLKGQGHAIPLPTN